MSALPPTAYERGMANGELRIALAQTAHHLSGLRLTAETVDRATSDGARPAVGLLHPSDIAAQLRALADRFAAAATTATEQRAA